MRELLFRGKRSDTGAWIYGTPFQDYNDFWGEWEWIIQTKHPLTNVPFMRLNVDYKTISQFTGLTDKNGKKIFEGDIVRYVNPDEDCIAGRVAYGEHSYSGIYDVGFYVKWQRPEWSMYLRDDLGFWTNFREIEVIGNIHDNPELLGGKDGN